MFFESRALWDAMEGKLTFFIREGRAWALDGLFEASAAPAFYSSSSGARPSGHIVNRAR